MMDSIAQCDAPNKKRKAEDNSERLLADSEKVAEDNSENSFTPKGKYKKKNPKLVKDLDFIQSNEFVSISQSTKRGDTRSDIIQIVPNG